MTITITPHLFFQYTRSPHWIWYDKVGDLRLKKSLSQFAQRLIEGGVIHEEEYVKSLPIVSVKHLIEDEEAQAYTEQLMLEGIPFIYQGYISYHEGDVLYAGRPDLLKKYEGESALGNHYYVPIEIKYSGWCDEPEYQMQLMFYAMILEKIQGKIPEKGWFINKNKRHIPCELNSKVLKKTKEAIVKIADILNGIEPPLKITSQCKDMPWFDVLIKEAETRQDIALVYRLHSNSLFSLREAGVHTISDLANIDIQQLPKIKNASLDRLRCAQLQAKSLLAKKIHTISKPNVPQAITKIFFDIEGDPYLYIDYLFGCLLEQVDGTTTYHYFLAEKPEDEKKMWQAFLNWLEEINVKEFKVYHYHHYEKTHLTDLMKRYGGSEKLIVFMAQMVDLAKIVEEHFIFPIYFYSIKDIAKYLNFKWKHAKAGGAQSIFWYEEWLESQDNNILQDIIHYNEDDVRATQFLYHWLVDHHSAET